jgi:hypothetical protein
VTAEIVPLSGRAPARPEPPTVSSIDCEVPIDRDKDGVLKHCVRQYLLARVAWERAPMGLGQDVADQHEAAANLWRDQINDLEPATVSGLAALIKYHLDCHSGCRFTPEVLLAGEITPEQWDKYDNEDAVLWLLWKAAERIAASPG